MTAAVQYKWGDELYDFFPLSGITELRILGLMYCLWWGVEHKPGKWVTFHRGWKS